MTDGKTLQRVSELYGDLGNWPKVGRAVAISAVEQGEIDAVTERHVNRYQALANALYHGRIERSPTLRRALGIRVTKYRSLVFRFYDDSEYELARREVDAHEAGRVAWLMEQVT